MSGRNYAAEAVAEEGTCNMDDRDQTPYLPIPSCIDACNRAIELATPEIRAKAFEEAAGILKDFVYLLEKPSRQAMIDRLNDQAAAERAKVQP